MAKLTGHGMMRVVVIVIVVVRGDYFEVMTLNVKVNLCGLLSAPYVPPITFSGLGSIKNNLDLSLVN